MDERSQTSLNAAFRVLAGEDLFGERRGLGINTVDIKVTSPDGSGLFVAEIINHAKGGPARHFHYNQDEWFYILEGEYIVEVGQQRFSLKSGDSVFAPRKVPHVWASVGEGGRGRMLVVFPFADRMEAFFRETSITNALPLSPEVFRSYGMEMVGPPLSID